MYMVPLMFMGMFMHVHACSCMLNSGCPAPINHFNQKRGDIQLFVYLLVWFGGAGKILPLLSNSSRDHQSLGLCSEGYYCISYRRAFRIQKTYDGLSQKSLNMVVQ